MKGGEVKLFLTFCVFSFVFLGIAQSITQVIVEFFYWDPSTDLRFCPHCSHWIKLHEGFLTKNETITNIQSDYADKVLVEWIEYRSEDGQEKAASYNITSPNSVMINGEVRIEGKFNETALREIIDAHLNDQTIDPQSSPDSFAAILTLAFSFGFFETFSPCLIACTRLFFRLLRNFFSLFDGAFVFCTQLYSWKNS